MILSDRDVHGLSVEDLYVVQFDRGAERRDELAKRAERERRAERLARQTEVALIVAYVETFDRQREERSPPEFGEMNLNGVSALEALARRERAEVLGDVGVENHEIEEV